jgi:hypothetical protein
MVAGTDAIRQPNDDPIETVTNLTTYQEDEAKIEQHADGISSAIGFDATRYLQSQLASVILSRSYKIDEFSWEVGSAVGDVLGNYRFPQVLYDQPWIKQLVDQYGWFRAAKVCLSVRIQSTIMHQGAICVSHTYENYGRIGSFGARFNNRPVLVSAVPAGVVEIELPWTSPFPWVDTANLRIGDNAAMGQFILDVIAPLDSVGTTKTAVTVQVFANFEDPEVMGPSILRNITAIEATGQSEMIEGMAKSAKGIMSDISDEKYLDAGIKTVGLAIDVAKNVGPLLLDKPQSDSGQTMIAFEHGKDFPAGTGLQPGVSLSLIPGASHESTAFYGARGEHSLHNLQSTPGFYETLTFDNQSPPVFWSTRVDPIKFIPSGVPDVYSMPFVTYFSLPFRWWSGSLTYHFDFFCSKFTSARIRIAWHPNATIQAPNPSTRSGDIISRVVDITGDTSLTITIPYAYHSVMRRISKTIDEPVDNNLFTNGVITMDFVGPIVSQVPVATISMVVWINAGPDYKTSFFDNTMSFSDDVKLLNEPNDPVNQNWREDAPPFIDADGQSAIWDRIGQHDPLQDVVGHENAGMVMSEDVDDLLAYAKRFQPVVDLNNGVWSSYPAMNSAATDSSRYLTIGWATACFTYWSGSLRFKCLRDMQDLGKMYRVHEMNDIEGSIPYGISFAASAGNVQNQIDFSVPYFERLPYKFVAAFVDLRYFQELQNNDFNDNQALNFMAAGDDFRVFHMFAPPYILERETPPLKSSDFTRPPTPGKLK